MSLCPDHSKAVALSRGNSEKEARSARDSVPRDALTGAAEVARAYGTDPLTGAAEVGSGAGKASYGPISRAGSIVRGASIAASDLDPTTGPAEVRAPRLPAMPCHKPSLPSLKEK